jgi:hypothetical protein
MTLNTLQWFIPLMKFHAYGNFSYITAQVGEHKKELQSYYKLMEEDLKEITKDWLAYLLIPANPGEMSNPKIDSS